MSGIKKFLQEKGKIIDVCLSLLLIALLISFFSGTKSVEKYFSYWFFIIVILQLSLQLSLACFIYPTLRKDSLEKSAQQFKEKVRDINDFLDEILKDPKHLDNKEMKSSIKLIKMELEIINSKIAKL